MNTVITFKKRILENGKLKAYEKLLKEITNIALEKGSQLGSIQVIDSVHTEADVNVEKDERRQKDGQPPRDGDARWGVSLQDPVGKGKRVVSDERERKRKERVYFYGYKRHVSMNAESGLITTIRHNPGSAYDGYSLPTLIEDDLEQGVPVSIVAADRGYDDGENHEFLREKGIASAIHLNSYRTKKRDKNREIWVKLCVRHPEDALASEGKESPSYQYGLRERRKIEGKFGEMKKHHGFGLSLGPWPVIPGQGAPGQAGKYRGRLASSGQGRCRYLGLLRYAIQGYPTAIMVGLKRIVRLLAGVGLKVPGVISGSLNPGKSASGGKEEEERKLKHR